MVPHKPLVTTDPVTLMLQDNVVVDGVFKFAD